MSIAAVNDTSRKPTQDHKEDQSSTATQGEALGLFAICAAILLAAAASHFVAKWVGLPEPQLTYRQVGPRDGPQVFCAGSSVVQFGLSWPTVSEALGQGIENWGLGGSTPSEWEVSQDLATNTNLMIIGFSLHDMNEYFLCDARANVVPVKETVRDLWESKTDWRLSRRILSQYPQAYLRKLFPTAGKSDSVLVGLRRRLHEMVQAAPTAAEKDNFLVLPSQAVLSFGDATEKVSDWPPDKALRRLDLWRSQIQGSHSFKGPKHLAFLRMLNRAQLHGRVIVVVVPLAPLYMEKFVTPEVTAKFEEALADAGRVAPQALFVRLDRLPVLDSNEYFSDLFHLNGAGKGIATQALLEELKGKFH